MLPLTTIRRERGLPCQGEVLVNPGQRVEPRDVVARASRPQPHRILDVAKVLDVSPDRTHACCVKHPGEPVEQGETLAQHRAGFARKRRIVSPVDGTVVATSDGRMIIEPRPQLFELRALLSGLVTDTIPGFGVTIETPGALVQGVWGSGRESYGLLSIGVAEPDGVMEAEQIEDTHNGSILVCGATLDADVLTRAQEMNVRGLIVGGLPDELRAGISRQPVPVITTEGIGRIPISSPVYDLLQANEGREATMLARVPDRWLASRPEIVIPLPAATPPDLPGPARTALKVDAKVRIRRAPYWGAVGRVKSVHDEPRTVESGIKCPGADVVLEDGTVVFVPHVNLDLVG